MMVVDFSRGRFEKEGEEPSTIQLARKTVATPLQSGLLLYFMEIIGSDLYLNVTLILLMALEKRRAFVKQIALYFNSKEYRKAYSLAKEFKEHFPSDMIAHYLLAKAAFWVGEYEETVAEGRKAFNMAKAPDLLPCAIITASGYYQLGRYAEGHKMLDKIKVKGNIDLEKLKLAFAIVKGNEKKTTALLDELYKINKKEAQKLMEKMLLG